jgi:hypothetical protein
MTFVQIGLDLVYKEVNLTNLSFANCVFQTLQFSIYVQYFHAWYFILCANKSAE